MQIYHNEMDAMRVKLEEATKTKSVVMSGYDELTETLQAKSVAHKNVMANLQSRVTDGRKKSADMKIKVGWNFTKPLFNFLAH